MSPRAAAMMEVSCKQCQAKYQFDAAAIPAQGYDAQCTHCGAVFFVAPERAPEALISVTCAHCGAVYQFPASAIPAGGYDAQCTQCQQVFFVGTAPAATPPGTTAGLPAPAPVPAAAVADAVDVLPPHDPSPVIAPTPAAPVAEPIALDQPKRSDPLPPESPGVDSRLADPSATDAADLVAMADELGEPLSSPDGTNIEEDFERILARRRKRRQVVLAIAIVLFGYLAITYLLLPRVFDLTIGRFVGIKLTANPEAVPPTERGALLLLDDTDAAYQAALVELSRALQLDTDYAEAVAWYGLANILRGEDIRALGRAAHRAAADAIAELRAFEELPAADRPADLEARVEALRKAAKANADLSSRYFEQGSKVVRDGFARLRAGVEKNDRVPSLVEAAGIYYAMDSDSLKRAEELFHHAVRLRLGEQGKFELKNPPSPWLAFLRGMILAQDPNKQDEAAAAFAAAVNKEPRLVRALWEQTKLAERRGEPNRARELARSVLAKVPAHEKAAALLSIPEPAPVVPAVDVRDGQVKSKKRKAKKKR